MYDKVKKVLLLVLAALVLLFGVLYWRSAAGPEGVAYRDVLYFLAESFRARLAKELPPNRSGLTGDSKLLAVNAKALLTELAGISLEIAQMAISSDDGSATLPAWFIVDASRELPALAQRKSG